METIFYGTNFKMYKIYIMKSSSLSPFFFSSIAFLVYSFRDSIYIYKCTHTHIYTHAHTSTLKEQHVTLIIG